MILHASRSAASGTRDSPSLFPRGAQHLEASVALPPSRHPLHPAGWGTAECTAGKGTERAPGLRGGALHELPLAFRSRTLSRPDPTLDLPKRMARGTGSEGKRLEGRRWALGLSAHRHPPPPCSRQATGTRAQREKKQKTDRGSSHAVMGGGGVRGLMRLADGAQRKHGQYQGEDRHPIAATFTHPMRRRWDRDTREDKRRRGRGWEEEEGWWKGWTDVARATARRGVTRGVPTHERTSRLPFPLRLSPRRSP